MNKFKILLKISVLLALKLVRGLIFSAKKIFGKKTILFVSKKQIKSYSIGPTLQIAAVLFFLWIGSLFVQLLKYDDLIREKTSEITELKKTNEQFEREVNALNTNLEKINNYFNSISKYENVKAEEDFKTHLQQNVKKRFKEIFGDVSLNEETEETAMKIASSDVMLGNIKKATIRRINDLQKKLAIAGLSVSNNKIYLNTKKNYYDEESFDTASISLNDKNDLRFRQGGPFQKTKGKSLFDKIANESPNTTDISNEIEYLTNLEGFVYRIPLSKPMNNYYVSSGFGGRTDPIRGVRAIHQGMDFAGPAGERVISPSPGKVIFAGKFGAYGNGIILDHGYGITTRYGHLSHIKVNEGDFVKKGQTLGIQGTTGRSTGPHLHYEIRYKNTPLNPKKFLQAGGAIFNEDQVPNHVDS